MWRPSRMGLQGVLRDARQVGPGYSMRVSGRREAVRLGI